MRALQGEISWALLCTAQMRETSLLDQREPPEREKGLEPSCFEGFMKGGKEQEKPDTDRDGGIRGISKAEEGSRLQLGQGNWEKGSGGGKELPGLALGLRGAHPRG